MTKLVSENLRGRFGDIRLEIIFQDATTRVSCIRRVADNVVLSFHIVLFTEDGIKALGPAHEKIVAGEMLGETIQSSGIAHEREVSGTARVDMPARLAALFKTPKPACSAEHITYRVRGVPYATIYEFYNPEFTPVAQLLGTLNPSVRTLMQKYLVG